MRGVAAEDEVDEADRGMGLGDGSEEGGHASGLVEGGDDDVGRGEETFEQGPRLGSIEVQGEAVLAAVVEKVGEGAFDAVLVVEERGAATNGVARGVLHADDVGAEFGEEAGAEDGGFVGEVEDGDIFEGEGGGHGVGLR